MDAGQSERLIWTMIGNSTGMLHLCRLIQTYGPSDATVLVQGESGTGKELIGQAIHQSSPRRDGPFVHVNCAAIAEGLLESELFGHEHGSFSGAISQRIGKFEQANRGTLFLDEIGEASPAFQAKLLCAIETRRIDRVGGRGSVPLSIRIVAATNRDLRKDVKDGRFREDLYYRFNVLNIYAPPLRERREDIPLLAQYFAVQFGKAGISEEAADILMQYDWPGNVRELRNLIQRGTVLAGADVVIGAEHLRPESRDCVEKPRTLHETKQHATGSACKEALDRTNGSKAEAARLLNVHRSTVHRQIKKQQL